METSSPTAIVEEFLRALEQKDFDRGVALLHDNVVYQNVPLPADRGKPAVIKTLRSFERFVNKLEVRMINIAENGPMVLTERIDILSGPVVHLDIWVCGTFEVRDGKIILWRDYFDIATVATKLLSSPVRKLFGLVS